MGGDGGGCRVRGAFVVQLRDALRERGKLAEADERLPSEIRAAWGCVQPSSLVDERICTEGLRAAHQVLGLDEAAWRSLMRQQAALAIQRHYRLFLRFLTPRLLFGGLPRMWSLTHSDGSLALERWADRGVRVVYCDHPPLAVAEQQTLTVAVLEALADANHTPIQTTVRPAADPARRFEVDVAW